MKIIKMKCSDNSLFSVEMESRYRCPDLGKTCKYSATLSAEIKKNKIVWDIDYHDEGVSGISPLTSGKTSGIISFTDENDMKKKWDQFCKLFKKEFRETVRYIKEANRAQIEN